VVKINPSVVLVIFSDVITFKRGFMYRNRELVCGDEAKLNK